MLRAGPRKVQRYSLEFKLRAVVSAARNPRRNFNAGLDHTSDDNCR